MDCLSHTLLDNCQFESMCMQNWSTDRALYMFIFHLFANPNCIKSLFKEIIWLSINFRRLISDNQSHDIVLYMYMRRTDSRSVRATVSSRSMYIYVWVGTGHVYVPACVFVCTECVYVCVYTRVCAICVCVCVRVHTCVCAYYVHVYLHGSNVNTRVSLDL